MRSADLDLVGRIRSGDGAAFEAVYRQHATRLYNLASRMMGGYGEADDLLQDIFLLAYRKLGSFRGESSLGTWLYRLAMNHCLDVLRNRQTRMGQQTVLEELLGKADQIHERDFAAARGDHQAFGLQEIKGKGQGALHYAGKRAGNGGRGRD